MGPAEIVEKIETLFKTYPFAKECVLVFLSVILGGIFTAVINNGAMRKKCKFDMQYEILKSEIQKIDELHKSLEGLEIGLSFTSRRTVDFQKEIQAVASMMLKINERLREQRKFVRKYLSATLVEESARIVAEYHKIMFSHGGGGIMDFQMIDEANVDTLNGLRPLTSAVQKLNDGLAESLETLIAPGLIAKVKRKLRKPVMFIEECYAIKVVHQKNEKSSI